MDVQTQVLPFVCSEVRFATPEDRERDPTLVAVVVGSWQGRPVVMRVGWCSASELSQALAANDYRPVMAVARHDELLWGRLRCDPGYRSEWQDDSPEMPGLNHDQWTRPLS